MIRVGEEREGDMMSGKTTKRRLLEIMTEYLEAITDNDTSRLPLAKGVKITDNGIKTKLASSEVWGTPRRIPYRQTFVDPQTGSAVFFGIVTNTNTRHAGYKAKWWFYLLRIKVENDLITEIEEITNDNIYHHYETYPWEMTPTPAFRYVLPEDERTSREEMIAIVDNYWDAVERNGDPFSVPFHPDMQRNESGTITTNTKNFPNSSRGDFTKTANKGWRWDIRKRRFPIVDVQRGLLISFVDLKCTEETNPDFVPCILAEIFKIESGHLRDLLAFFYVGDNDSDW
jgi:hypothetical protein